ncbi:uncharacterized protein BO88DRAFT_244269 [Aspergillus vadensis CBS 113365]|uniref:Uncharacterized protein n=1 Tax=Aspergillus vadensis (strain CBS 113365 / IMI 142717 / IBT 24658) TaxID=1448311 RepID=A0A319BD85_ASPVC|nr:hypothetical protein BO88DRAFT_244269 [Aspergillus vadensis CBS 113365]PYH71106.1 hypothetical protein BO88DRAFT_244269 [Aspergillus vadensis CBS 113365]
MLATLLLENLISCGSSLLPTSFHGYPVLTVPFWVSSPPLCFPYTPPSLFLPVDPVCSGPSVGETRCLRYPSLLPTWLVPSRYLSVTQTVQPWSSMAQITGLRGRGGGEEADRYTHTHRERERERERNREGIQSIPRSQPWLVSVSISVLSVF